MPFLARVIPSVAPLLENQEKALLFPCGHPCLEQLGRQRSVPIPSPHKENHFTAQGLKVGWSGHMGTSFILLSNPTLQLIQTGKGEAIRIRSILRSLVPTEDLVGIISIPLKLPSLNKGKGMAEDGVLPASPGPPAHSRTLCAEQGSSLPPTAEQASQEQDLALFLAVRSSLLPAPAGCLSPLLLWVETSLLHDL